MDQSSHFHADHFALFHLTPAFAIDMADLERRYRDVQSQMHPDRFVDAPEAERRRSLQWATRANEAFLTLKKPLSRAQYLLELAGHDLQAENNTAMDPAFLMEQMEWREAVQEAKEAASVDDLDELHQRLRHNIAEQYGELGQLFDTQHDIAAAAELTRRLMFLDRLLHEIDDALHALDA